MTVEEMKEVVQSSIKSLEWEEDYHQRKLDEAEIKLEIFRNKLKQL